MRRLAAVYAGIAFIAVVALGLVLASTYRSVATNRGLAEGRSEAILIAQTAVEPELDGRPLSKGLTASELADLRQLVSRAVHQHDVLRLRLRDLSGRVVFSDDGSGFGVKPEDEVLQAARGRSITRLTHLNTDSNDHGARGPATVEVYLPLVAGSAGTRVGVLEIYLPYGPIAADVNAGLRTLYVDLGVGLTVLYLLLLAITLSVTRGLRREAAVNAFLAHHDPLTELPNRALFLKRIKESVAHSMRTGQPTAVAIVDLDHFKDINETLSHECGDQVLTALAQRLDANISPGDTVARLGGDEFGLVLRGLVDPHGALCRLREVIAAEIEVRGLPLTVEPSIGFITMPGADVDLDALLQHADIAMYAAKAQHEGVLEYRPDFDHFDASSLALVAELRGAITAGDLVVHYQPQLNAATGQIEAVEALVRWQHPVHGLLYPDRFLPLAEQTDLIDKLTEWVLKTALADIHELSTRGYDLSVAVNVSARNIVRVDFAEQVIAALTQSKAPAHRLTAEVTETALLTDPDRATSVLATLAKAGVCVSLDDFGRGQTSLAYLSTLPISELKIDRSFVTDIRDNPSHAAIVRSVIDLGHNLSMRVVAEGIETEEVLSTLRLYECDIAQGYFLARPMPFDKLQRWLSDQATPEPPIRAATRDSDAHNPRASRQLTT